MFSSQQNAFRCDIGTVTYPGNPQSKWKLIFPFKVKHLFFVLEIRAIRSLQKHNPPTYGRCAITHTSSSPEYDLVVIGGGSGGLACSKAAREFGASVALIDGVTPSPHGTTWGIGGTCTNVGCIPKKLMHLAGIVGREVGHAPQYGWLKVEKGEHSWETLVKVVSDRIRANNWIYRVQLNEKKVMLYTALACFVGNRTIKTVSADNRKTELILHAKNVVVATGLRPRYPDIPGAKYGITSDDLFSLSKPPGRTLVVGASYVALECAGFLAHLGFPVHLLIRSRPLKPFDQKLLAPFVSPLQDPHKPI
ncbi:unnamed protein product [Heligmosomoides polygyrus]|uniref:Pyr_redox_2 domain-containing protein n=1 Tax=Heligmosomoides polygyrus TaxID=6339 RepID=A0A183GVV5_HELPZ|nr:unnamed protein product [Heligmosomoides polygyrus]